MIDRILLAILIPMRSVFILAVGPAALAANLVLHSTIASPAESAEQNLEPVPVEEYPIYNRVVEDKFLTSRTTLVVIDRLTVTRLHPEAKEPPNLAFFREHDYFNGRLRPDLVTDVILKNSRPFRLEARFNFGVPYRFMSGGELEEPEVSLAPIPTRFPRAEVTQVPQPVIGKLGFSRVAFTPRADQALVYVADDRPDGTGAGFLVWLRRLDRDWEILDTEVLWVARRDE
ncbi:MAG: hypothetical protein E6K63_10925 [Nitrospirae bacterium]|nr:MAG: hypothetical protein E6K63_10925 [Nitrospirota bacterium]